MRIQYLAFVLHHIQGQMLKNVLKKIKKNLLNYYSTVVFQFRVLKFGCRKLFWDASNANRVAVPKSEQDIKAKTEVCLEMLEYLKLTKAPSGVVLNKLEVFFKKVMALNWLKTGSCSSKLIGIHLINFFLLT